MRFHGSQKFSVVLEYKREGPNTSGPSQFFALAQDQSESESDEEFELEFDEELPLEFDDEFELELEFELVEELLFEFDDEFELELEFELEEELLFEFEFELDEELPLEFEDEFELLLELEFELPSDCRRLLPPLLFAALKSISWTCGAAFFRFWKKLLKALVPTLSAAAVPTNDPADITDAARKAMIFFMVFLH